MSNDVIEKLSDIRADVYEFAYQQIKSVFNKQQIDGLFESGMQNNEVDDIYEALATYICQRNRCY